MNNKEINNVNKRQISVASEMLIFSISDKILDNYRKLSQKNLSVLLIKRDKIPFRYSWCLPGKIIDVDETAYDASQKLMSICTNDSDYYLEQLHTFDSINRDPFIRLISTAHIVLIDKDKININNIKDASWFNLNIIENNNILELQFDNGIENFKVVLEKIIKKNNKNDYTYNIIESNCIAYDHSLVIAEGIKYLKDNINNDIIFYMMPQLFTLGELQQVYEELLNKKLLDSAFRRSIAAKVKPTSRIKTGEGHRPSRLFEYQKEVNL